MPGFNLKTAKPEIVLEFQLPTDRAMQCPALDPDTGEFYVSQAKGIVKPESILISRQSASGPKRVPVGLPMELAGAGHGSTITTLRRGGVLGIVTRAWGDLVWVPYVAGAMIKKGDKRVKPIWKYGYAYIDHEQGTVCLRSGNAFYLYALDGEKLGKLLGKADHDQSSSGPSQGFCTLKAADGEFYLLTMWDYGRLTNKPTVVVGSLRTGKRLYAMSARVLGNAYRQEPESGMGIGGVFHLGMSLVDHRGAEPRGVVLAFPLDPTPKLGARVLMWVRSKSDLVWAAPPLVVTNRTKGGDFGLLKRPPGFAVKGVVVVHPVLGGLYVKTKAGNYYSTKYLTGVRP